VADYFQSAVLYEEFFMAFNSLRTILYPTDFSRPCDYALGVACALARDRDARLLLLHVVPREVQVMGGEGMPALHRVECFEQDHRKYREDMQRRLQDLALPGLRVHAEHLLREGDAVAAILRAAEEHSCDLIVMGTHGRTGEARRLMGSVAEEVMQKAPCPVVAVKVPLAESRPAEEPSPEEVGVIL